MPVELSGIQMEGEFVWDVHDYELCRLLLALPSLVPADAVAYFEGGALAEDVRQFLSAHPAPVTSKIYPGTIAPAPEIFHVPAAQGVLSALAQIAEQHACCEVCDHFHVYRAGTVLVQGHDFGGLPLMLSDAFPEQQVADFCQKMGARYERRQIAPA